MSDNLPAPAPEDSGEFLLYQTEDGETRIEVRMAEDTIWLSQRAMANLFQTTKQNVSLHLQNIYEEGELRPAATVKQYLTVQTEGARRVSRVVDHYSLDAIKDRIANIAAIEQDDLDYVPFNTFGGLGKAYDVFDDGLTAILDELNARLAA